MRKFHQIAYKFWTEVWFILPDGWPADRVDDLREHHKDRGWPGWWDSV